jgi:oligopeptide transport system ATP-binding protein
LRQAAIRTSTIVPQDIPDSSSDILLQLRDLNVRIPSGRGDIHAVRNVSFQIARGERVAILGESGSGKTVTALTLLGLKPPNAIARGSLYFDGRLTRFEDDRASTVRPAAGIVFQDSLSSLNPIARIGTQLVEMLTLKGWAKKAAFVEATRMLGRVGVPDAQARMQAYPHELSGGMRQRVMITMALLSRPKLLVADEPTTALDTTVQAQVIDLIRSLQQETQMGLLLITHDLAMAAEVCDRAIVMYGGYVVEDLPMAQLLRAARHPYTRALLKAMPRLDSPRHLHLDAIDGEPPSPRTVFTACPFMPRCDYAGDDCARGVPELETPSADHKVRCVRHRVVAASSMPQEASA